MHIPPIDLSAAAESYGLSYVPPLRWASWLENLQYGDSKAGFMQSERDIVVWPSLFSAPTDYDESRYAAVGVGHLDYPDSAAFVLAHELWHARQDEIDSNGLRNGDQPNTSQEHDSNVWEHSADVHAAAAYRLITIGR